MPAEPYKPIIFISYAHADEPEKPAEGEVKWLSFVTGYLRPAVKHGAVELWVDRLMPGGADVDPEIERKLRACDIFILLVSRHSLSSDYIADKEIAIIRERQAKGEDVHFYPLMLTPTPKIALKLVRDKNLRPRDGKPFSDYSINERYRHMSEAADEIAEIATQIAARSSGPRPEASSPPPPSSPPTASTTPHEVSAQIGTPLQVDGQRHAEQEIDDEESLKSWLTGQRREVVVVIAARTALRVVPLAVREAQERSSNRATSEFTAMISGVFRATALAWVVSRYPSFANDLGPAANLAADAAHDTARSNLVSAARVTVTAAAIAAAAVSHFARAAIAVADQEQLVADALTSAAVGEVSTGVALAAATFGYAPIWQEVRSDIAALRELPSNQVVALPLWSHGAPQWAKDAWADLQVALPKGEDWEVWVDWYAQRLRGGSLGETHEVTFAAVTKDVWETGPASANAWIRELLPTRQVDGRRSIEPAISDRESLEAWLMGQSREVAVAIAARAALRVAPLAVRIIRDRQSAEGFKEVAKLTSAIYRSNASARVAAKYPARANEVRAAAHLAASRTAAFASGNAASVASAASATSAALAVFAAAPAVSAADSVAAAVAAASNADAADFDAAFRAWEETLGRCHVGTGGWRYRVVRFAALVGRRARLG